MHGIFDLYTMHIISCSAWVLTLFMVSRDNGAVGNILILLYLYGRKCSQK